MGYRIKIGSARIAVREDGRITIEKPKRRKSVSQHIQDRKSKRVKVVKRGGG